MTHDQFKILNELLRMSVAHGYDSFYDLTDIAKRTGVTKVLYDNNTETGILWPFGQKTSGIIRIDESENDGEPCLIGQICYELSDTLKKWCRMFVMNFDGSEDELFGWSHSLMDESDADNKAPTSNEFIKVFTDDEFGQIALIKNSTEDGHPYLCMMLNGTILKDPSELSEVILRFPPTSMGWTCRDDLFRDATLKNIKNHILHSQFSNLSGQTPNHINYD